MTSQSLTKSQILEQLAEIVDKKKVLRSRKHLYDFTKYTTGKFDPTTFHENYYEVLDLFAKKKIKNLIISVPPQHGKSEGSSRRLPAYVLGLDPNRKIALASYNSTFASKFNREVQRIIDSPEYEKVFPETTLNKSNVVTVSGNYLRNSEEFEVVNKSGSFKAVGVGGGLTGNPVDLMIMDDLYKDYLDACSPTISQNVWDWYTTVVKTRLHNDSQQLIVFTRWDENDLIGRLEKKGKVKEFTGDFSMLEDLKHDEFLKINFEAIKTGKPTKFDPRKAGEALWPGRHSLEKLISEQEMDPQKFSSVYQGQPRTKEGLTYREFGTYKKLPLLKYIGSYTDVADKGSDYLCTIFYGIPIDEEDEHIYIIDVIYTQEAQEETEIEVPERIELNDSTINYVESNNGGRAFARTIDKALDDRYVIEDFHQSNNKEARIHTNSGSVNKTMLFQEDWEIAFPDFANEIINRKKKGKNLHDDGADALTGVYEKEKGGQDFFVL